MLIRMCTEPVRREASLKNLAETIRRLPALERQKYGPRFSKLCKLVRIHHVTASVVHMNSIKELEDHGTLILLKDLLHLGRCNLALAVAELLFKDITWLENYLHAKSVRLPETVIQGKLQYHISDRFLRSNILLSAMRSQEGIGGQCDCRMKKCLITSKHSTAFRRGLDEESIDTLHVKAPNIQSNSSKEWWRSHTRLSTYMCPSVSFHQDELATNQSFVAKAIVHMRRDHIVQQKELSTVIQLKRVKSGALHALFSYFLFKPSKSSLGALQKIPLRELIYENLRIEEDLKVVQNLAINQGLNERQFIWLLLSRYYTDGDFNKVEHLGQKLPRFSLVELEEK
ncbi:unnamed product [Ostreococcus tauri]|uniref:Unnamed product n=1 Tax=Ostreococcus tauri TaxID=70448 RepID=A0A090M7A8_OSTTA|nr:unnamed product [Ostreococcus tauri]CEG00972.1 unnamed product [Ostreococcus tauri]|eukprot:XP_022840710.1 unnamed product [Ostreococcus tauri]